METQELKRIVEALIFAADAPINAERILDTLELKNGFALSALIDELNAEYQQSGRAFTIRQVAGGYQIVTQSQYASWIKKLYLGRQKTRLSQAALETLALVAFKQPISRVEIAQIRGVNSDGVIGTLLERKLITISGRSEAVGRPLLYSTTPEFLKYFGLNDIADLPKPREIEELFGKEGMPEELLHALSQEDPQLSLPINTDAAAISEEADNKTTPSLDQPSPAVVAIPLPVNMPQEFFSSEMDETPVEEPSPTTPVSEPESIPLDINEEVVTFLDDSNEPESLSDEPANVPASTPASNNEQEAISTPDDADIPPVQDGSSPASKLEENPETGLNDDENIRATPLDDFHGIDTWVDQRDKISSVTLAAGVEELFQISSESPSEEMPVVEIRAGDDITVISNAALGETPFVLTPANDDLFATIDEIALIGEPLPLPSPSAQTPQPSKNAMVNSESTVDILLNTLESISAIEKTEKANGALEAGDSSSFLKSDPASEIDGWLAEEFSREEIAEPGIFQDFNAVVVSGQLDGGASENDPIAKSRLDALSLALPDFPDLTQVETKIEKATPELAAAPSTGEVEFIAETTPPSENVISLQAEASPPVEIIPEATPAPSDNAMSWQVEESPLVEFISETRSAPTEEVTALQVEAPRPVEFTPETALMLSENATPSQFEAPMQVEFVAETAPEIFETPAVMSAEVKVPAGQENATPHANRAENFSSEVFFPGESVVNQTPPRSTAPEIITQLVEFTSAKINEKTDSRWEIFREKTVGWIKRTFNKLMTLVGARS